MLCYVLYCTIEQERGMITLSCLVLLFLESRKMSCCFLREEKRKRETEI